MLHHTQLSTHTTDHTHSVLQVESNWEDCSYRIESLNILLFMAESLKEGIEELNQLMSVENYDTDEVRSKVGLILDTFSESLDQSMPELPASGFNRLDKLIKDRRDQEWDILRGDADAMRMQLVSRSIQELLSELEDYMLRLKSLAVEVCLCVSLCTFACVCM